jgi:hypothetical protein
MALDHSSTGSSMLVFVMRALSVELIRRAAPRGASLAENTLSRITTRLEPEAATAPPRPVLTRNGVLDQETSYDGQQSGPSHVTILLQPGYCSDVRSTTVGKIGGVTSSILRPAEASVQPLATNDRRWEGKGQAAEGLT